MAGSEAQRGASLRAIRSGCVIPAHPLALTSARKLDERHQRALTRYYVAAGAGGVAVGVHTTQFAIRDAQHGLLRPVLELVAETARASLPRLGTPAVAVTQPFALVAGICGATTQAVAEAELATSLGYDAGLISLAAMRGRANRDLLAHCRVRHAPHAGLHVGPQVLDVRRRRDDAGHRRVRDDELEQQLRPARTVNVGCPRRQRSTSQPA